MRQITPAKGRQQLVRQSSGAAPPIAVGIVHASAVVREVLARAFSRRTGFAHIYTFTSTQEILDEPIPQPCVLLCDWGTVERGGYPAAFELSVRVPEAKIVVFNVIRTPQAVAVCALMGAAACVFEDAPPDEVVEGALVVTRTAAPLHRYALAGSDGSAGARTRGTFLLRPPLTRREQETLRLVAQGLSNKEIAQRLSLRVQTVKNYLRQGFQKLDVRGRRDLVGLLGGDREGNDVR